MSENERDIIDSEAHEHKYFHKMLNMAEDDLDPFEYRLLAHYVRWSNLRKRKVEGYKKTAHLCKMSPSKLLQARQALIDKGYIKHTAPTAAQANRGIGGTVVIVDRWLENIERYSEPSLKMDKVDDKPGLNIDKKKERSTGKKEDSASQNDAGSAANETDPPRTDKPKSSKAPDLWYDNILAVWNLHQGGNTDMRKFLEGKATKKGWKEYNPPEGYTLTHAEEVCYFARWYRQTKQGGKQELSRVSERTYAALPIPCKCFYPCW